MEIKAVRPIPIDSCRSNGSREGIVRGRETGHGRVAKGLSISVALVAKGLGVGISCK